MKSDERATLERSGEVRTSWRKYATRSGGSPEILKSGNGPHMHFEYSANWSLHSKAI